MADEIKAVILAAGKGTRMKSSLPKVLHEIFSKPLVSWVIEAINGLCYKTQSLVVIGHQAERVEDYLHTHHSLAKVVVQKEQLGTGHAVAQTVPAIGNFEGDVLVVCGDTPLIRTKTLEELIKYHNQNKADITVMTAQFDDPTGYGRIVRDFKGDIIKIIEQKDATESQKEIKEVNTGVYCFKWMKVKSAFAQLKNNNAQGEYYLTDIIDWARRNSVKTCGYLIKDNSEIYGINSRQNLAEATKIMNNRKLDELMTNGVTIVDPNSTFISPDTTIGEDTTILPNTYINGKNEIAKNCKIGPMTHIRGNCEVGEGSKIGNFVELKNAKIAKNSNVCHLSYIGDAEIGSHVNIGAGTIFANYNSITKEKKKSTLQDGVSIGSNSVIVAPVELEENAFIAAGSIITKNVEKDSLAITRSPMRIMKDWVKTNNKEND